MNEKRKKWNDQTKPSLKKRESESNTERKKKTNCEQQGYIDKKRTELKQKRDNAAMQQERM